jgi:hypothetical protein
LIVGRNDLFLREGLDTPNQVEFAEQIKFFVKSNFVLPDSMRSAIAALDFTVEQISMTHDTVVTRLCLAVSRVETAL